MEFLMALLVSLSTWLKQKSKKIIFKVALKKSSIKTSKIQAIYQEEMIRNANKRYWSDGCWYYAWD